MNKDMLKALRGEINTALESVGKKYNVQLVADSCKYGPHNATYKLIVNKLSESGEVVDEYMSKLITYQYRLGVMFGITEEHLNKTFKFGNEDYVLSGYNPRARIRDAIVTKLSDGRKYLVSMQRVADALLGVK